MFKKAKYIRTFTQEQLGNLNSHAQSKRKAMELFQKDALVYKESSTYVVVADYHEKVDMDIYEITDL